MSHINTDECAAPEFFTGGAKLVPISSDNGKITPDNLTSVIRGTGNVHTAQPATVSLTQSCETGTVYQLDEIAALTDAARAHGLNVHMDGARFANGLISLNTSMAEMTWKSGIDVLSFGEQRTVVWLQRQLFFSNRNWCSRFLFCTNDPDICYQKCVSFPHNSKPIFQTTYGCVTHNTQMLWLRD